mgnify:CR=1 FL=1
MFKIFKFISFKKLQLIINGFKLGILMVSKRQKILFYLRVISDLKFEDFSKLIKIIKRSIYKQLKK